MGQVVFIFSPSTLGWEEAGLCEFQPSLAHIKFQARYTEGAGQQTDYGPGDRGILESVGVCLAVEALAGMRWCLWESEALCLLRNPLLSSAVPQHVSLRPNQANKHGTGQSTPSCLVHRNQELFKSRVWTEEAGRSGSFPEQLQSAAAQDCSIHREGLCLSQIPEYPARQGQRLELQLASSPRVGPRNSTDKTNGPQHLGGCAAVLEK